MKDVAARARVSVATASYVMAGRGRVSDKTRDIVLKAADELGFVRNAAAANLRSGQSRMIGVILNNIANPFFSHLVSELESAAYNEGFLTILATAKNDIERQRKMLESMVSQGVGAIILSPVHNTCLEDLEVAITRGIPIISCVRDLPECPVSFVGVDDELSGYLAMRSALRTGKKTAVFLGGYANTTTLEGRRAGVQRALKEAGLPEANCQFRLGPLSMEFGASELSEISTGRCPPPVVICFNDYVATGVYEAARELGLSVGMDFSIISFDNTPISSALTPSLTSVDIFPGKVGAIAAQRAAEMIHTGTATRTIDRLDPVLIERDSSSLTG
ncbi:LacI family DNA-binding transcriptional regulator [Pacificoceanicola onchidii]|uniref:LacI family DNA-binding transcriptional regulator n=1 Tax=Pacificoceanicola onchidii TaxID=2562685 RepID=UPI0014560149|nr:LacI family DNA-binding transcriptional regulator [Pacificoceanicola onchidii]